ncbi:MAG: tyrosine recombinase XerC [Clostridia bacterium]|nr:tyrosine recombinase XerC [Clostridia bacterium]
MQAYEDCPAFLRDFLIYLEVIQGKSKATVAEYHIDLRTFLRYLKCSNGLASFDSFEQTDVSDVSPDDLKSVTLSFLYEYMYYISSVRHNSGNSRARKVSSIKTFFKYLSTKTSILTENPAKDLDAPKIPSSLPKYLSLDESIHLLDSIGGEFKIRDYCIITLFLNCGLRLSELVGINISSIKNDSLTVIGKGNKERTVYLNTACKHAIDEYLKIRPHENVKDRDALFLSKQKRRISNKMVQVIVKKSLENAGLDTKKYSTHKLRHTAATLMYKHGNVDVRALQEILGHKQLSTTQIYTHVDSEQLRDAAYKNPLSNIEMKEE